MESEKFKLAKDTITNNQLYVALTRASRNVYILSKDKFDKCKEKYMKILWILLKKSCQDQKIMLNYNQSYGENFSTCIYNSLKALL